MVVEEEANAPTSKYRLTSSRTIRSSLYWSRSSTAYKQLKFKHLFGHRRFWHSQEHRASCHGRR